MGSGENSYHVVNGSVVGASAVLDGSTVTAGNSTGGFPDSVGGGMINGRLDVVGSPTVSGCVFSGNSATDGGGVSNLAGSSTGFSNCEFSNNTASSVGGGVHNFDSSQGTSSPSFTGCTFTANSAPAIGGGAFYSQFTNAVLTDCVFVGNSTNQRGGALYLRQGSVSITRCTFDTNTATEGGAIQTAENPATTTVTDSIFVDNSALFGGAISNVFGATISFTNTLFHENSSTDVAGAVLTADNGGVTADNCTFSDNTAGGNGGGFRIDGGTNTFTNCILSGNTSQGGGNTGESAQISVSGGSVTPTFTLIEGINIYAGGAGNIGGDPLFVNPAADNYRLTSPSPAIDSGDNASVSAANGLDGSTRIIDGDSDAVAIVNMGAYENQEPPVCGDNVTEGSEQCDDGNTANGDGCDENCQNETAACLPPTVTAALGSRYIQITPDFGNSDPVAYRIERGAVTEWVQLVQTNYDDGGGVFVNIGKGVADCASADFLTPDQWTNSGANALYVTGLAVAPNSKPTVTAKCVDCSGAEAASATPVDPTWVYCDSSGDGQVTFTFDLFKQFSNTSAGGGGPNFLGPAPGIEVDTQGDSPTVPDQQVTVTFDIFQCFLATTAGGAATWSGESCP